MIVQIITLLVGVWAAVETVIVRRRLSRIVQVINEYLDSVMNQVEDHELDRESELLKTDKNEYRMELVKGLKARQNRDFGTSENEQQNQGNGNWDENLIIYRVLEEMFP